MNSVGKGENSNNKHFLLFQLCFYPITDRIHKLIYTLFVFCKCFQFGEVHKAFKPANVTHHAKSDLFGTHRYNNKQEDHDDSISLT